MSTGATYLLERLRDARGSAHTGDRWANEDLEDLGLEVAEFLCGALDVAALERELVARSQLDVDSILWLVNSLGAIAANDPQAFKLDVADDKGNPIDWQARIQRLRQATEGLETPQQLDTLEVLLRLNLLADGAVDTLLAALPPDHALKSELLVRLREKLALLADDKAMAFWSQLRFQVDPARDVHF